MGTMLIVAAEQVSGAHVMRARHKKILGTQRKKRLMRLRSENLMYMDVSVNMYYSVLHGDEGD